MENTLKVFARILAGFFAILFVLTTVLAFALYFTEQSAFDADLYKQALTEEKVYQRLPELAAQGLAIADVMGKGLSASMLMSNLQATLRIIGPEYHSPALIAKRLNELFIHNLKLIRFISIFIGIYSPDNFTLQYSNAGHHPPFLWKAASGEIIQLFPTGPAIGLSKEPDFSLNSITLERGDLLLLYTDGILELRNDEGEEFGEENLKNLMRKFNRLEAVKIIEEIRSAITRFSSHPQDDISLMALKRWE